MRTILKYVITVVFYWLLGFLVASGLFFFWMTEVKGYVLTMPAGGYGEVKYTTNAYTIVGANLREEIKCEFEEPIKYLNLINHWYDSNEEMYADYIVLADNDDIDLAEEIWGWSNCAWQPEDNWAACDMYLVKPTFVNADMNIDTIGHEVMHGACGSFHD